VPLAPPDEAVEAGPEAEPVAEPLLGLAELATGTLVLPAVGATEVTRVGTTTGAELATGAEEGTTGGMLDMKPGQFHVVELTNNGSGDGRGRRHNSRGGNRWDRSRRSR
jgi:hypothetical protein